MMIDLSVPATQEAVGGLVGVSRQAIGAMISEGKLPQSGALGEMVLAYCERLRDQAAGRLGDEVGGLDLVQERAALARSQRIAQDMKNSIARGEFAPIGLLADVLAVASSAIVDRLDQLEGTLRKSCPDLPHEAVEAILTIIASARNEWIRSTQRLAVERLDSMTTAADHDDADADADDFEDEEGRAPR